MISTVYDRYKNDQIAHLKLLDDKNPLYDPSSL